MWDLDAAPRVAAELLGSTGSRWAHVQTVGRLTDGLVRSVGLAPEVAAAAWLHDIGYAPAVVATNFHPLDGAAYLAHAGAPADVIALVAHHTGADYEAEERGLLAELSKLPDADPLWLDALTLVDLVVAPDGALTEPELRLDEILGRYAGDEPVHRAVTRSRPTLLAAAHRARMALGLPDVWPGAVLKGVLEA